MTIDYTRDQLKKIYAMMGGDFEHFLDALHLLNEIRDGKTTELPRRAQPHCSRCGAPGHRLPYSVISRNDFTSPLEERDGGHS